MRIDFKSYKKIYALPEIQKEILKLQEQWVGSPGRGSQHTLYTPAGEGAEVPNDEGTYVMPQEVTERPPRKDQEKGPQEEHTIAVAIQDAEGQNELKLIKMQMTKKAGGGVCAALKFCWEQERHGSGVWGGWWSLDA